MTNPTKILYVVLLTAGVTLMLVVHVLVFWAIKGGLGSRGRGATRAIEEDGHGGGLSAGELVRLPCHDFESADGEASGDCAVCLEAFEAGDRCRQLPRTRGASTASTQSAWTRG